ncbi:uncharacterized protein MONBRDRAFT_18941 [Monosiga brevicollis MX1]|uniref:Uncharacterized protein n=1 Tax=Monosiga brevicollis TaxID=81824 RepID=A9UXH5_MONBE|nr:uncharacterized protein MONBRDRAFT_18941 [Monosiga brevicollis MX1]EDQ89844.1 predicted protein [Monosiga brevicollis MX1]|eukprot:XP_001745266.1 hypothetical protein [Monosiga brevicollis MX1]
MRPEEAAQIPDLDFKHGLAAATREGVAGAKAMLVDIALLMWLRTVMNHQYRNGGTMGDTIRKLWRQGGVTRFYSGLTAAMIEAPLSRGVGAAANYATLNMLSRTSLGNHLPVVAQTALSSVGVGCFRLVYYPVDTIKTIMQVEGREGMAMLRHKVRSQGYGVLFHGAGSSIVGAAVRHTLWFTAYNLLDQRIETSGDVSTSSKMIRNALIGSACAVVTDVAANPLSLVKAYRQTNAQAISYSTIVRQIVSKEGVLGLFTRGLSTRIWVDILNSAIFTVVWRALLEPTLHPDNADEK